jgi:hypothetical protein
MTDQSTTQEPTTQEPSAETIDAVVGQQVTEGEASAPVEGDTPPADTPVEETPVQLSEAELIHQYVTEKKVIKGDTVRTKQAQSYLEMFGEQDPFEHPTLAGLTPEQLANICQSGAATLPLEDRKLRAESYAMLPPSHQWLKGIAASALAIKYLQSEEEDRPATVAALVEKLMAEMPEPVQEEQPAEGEELSDEAKAELAAEGSAPEEEAGDGEDEEDEGDTPDES